MSDTAKAKTFIATIPFQPEGQLAALRYEAGGNERLRYGEATRFPIVPAIAGYAGPGDRVRVIAILTEGENFRHNHEAYFVPEMEAMAARGGYASFGVEVVRTPDDEGIDAQLALFADIIARIGDGEEVSACITYGTKPTPLVVTLALGYAYRLKEGVSIGCVVYGRYKHGEAAGTLYDTTALFYMDSIVNRLAGMKAGDPERAVRAMLGIDGGERERGGILYEAAHDAGDGGGDGGIPYEAAHEEGEGGMMGDAGAGDADE